jgi:hypothetical protein
VAALLRLVTGKKSKADHEGYATGLDGQRDSDETTPLINKKKAVSPRYTNKLAFRRIFTPNVVSTLIAHGKANSLY